MRTKSDIKDPSLAFQGKKRIEWAALQMPVLNLIKENFKKEKPLKNVKISACLHVTSETANLVLTLKAGGANVLLCASNPLSTQDDVAAALFKENIAVFAKKGESPATYYRHIKEAIGHRPLITLDDGGDLTAILHKNYPQIAKKILGGTEETTTGVIRLKSLEKNGKLKYPIIAVNEAKTKYLFDNRYGTGQSTIDGITRATNILWAGKKVVICGYGWCGKGIALRSRGMGAKVIITEVNPIRALEALMDGFEVMPLSEASKIGDIFITATGCIDVIDKDHFKVMKDGAILANSGHFNVEINLQGLKSLSKKKEKIRPLLEKYTLKNGKRIYLLAEGRLVNLACAEGHPASVMDMSFSNQTFAVKYLLEKKGKLSPKVYLVPQEIDLEVAKLKLASMKVKIDKLSQKQKKYLSSWEMGT